MRVRFDHFNHPSPLLDYYAGLERAYSLSAWHVLAPIYPPQHNRLPVMHAG